METQQTTLLNLLNEYIILGYSEFPEIPYRNVDIELGELIIARWGEVYCTVIDLVTGNKLVIQKKLIRLCLGFYNTRGDEIVRLKETPGSSLWELIVISERIVGRRLVVPKKLKSTENIRLWLKNNHNILIEPILYITSDTVTDI